MIRGGNGLVDGPVLPKNLDKVMKKVAEQGFGHKPQVRIKKIIFYFVFLTFYKFERAPK